MAAENVKLKQLNITKVTIPCLNIFVIALLYLLYYGLLQNNLIARQAVPTIPRYANNKSSITLALFIKLLLICIYFNLFVMVCVCYVNIYKLKPLTKRKFKNGAK
jgi:uncharacterized protein with PQ loop repeat